MSVQVEDSTNITVNTMTMTANFVVNQVFLTLFRIAKGRNLSPLYLSEQRKVLEEGIFMWISEQTLKQLALEVFQKASDQAIERFEFDFNYVADPSMQVRQPAINSFEAFMATLNKLPDDATYHVLVTLKPNATQIEGWNSTQFKPLNITQKVDLGNWGFGKANVEMRYLGDQNYLRVEVN